ncbi:MAG: hypothetical protein HUK03_02505 [Bacteroidaceae bacterium]|nr:hypothetical protein [Bacteroidaceae bacterium]
MREKNEDELTQRVGKANPFRVPDDYFKTMPGRVSARIARRRHLMWMWRGGIAAALVIGAMVWGAKLFTMPESTANDTIVENCYTDEELEYSTINNTEIAFYLTEAN